MIFNIINLCIAFLALILAVITTYHQFFKNPKLRLSFKDEPPYSKYLNNIGISANLAFNWFIRIKVENQRKALAKNCFGKITEWYTENKLVTEFDPVRLHWVSNLPDDFTPIDLSYKEYDYLDLLITDEDNNLLKIYTNTHPRGIPVTFNLRESHIFKVSVYCENGESTHLYLKVVPEDNMEFSERIIHVNKINEKEIRSM